jgi:hypothetical protein
MKNLYEFSTAAPNMIEKENQVKLVYENTQPLKDTQKETGRQFLSDSDQDVKKFKTSFRKIVEDSEGEELDIQTTPAKICSNDKCKTGLSIEWKTWDNGLLCFGCWEYHTKYGSFINYKKEVRPIKTKNFNFLKSPRKMEEEKRANFYSSPIQRAQKDQNVYYSGRKRRQVSAKRNYKESSESGDDDSVDRKKLKNVKKIKENYTAQSSLEKKQFCKTTLGSPDLVKNSLIWAFLKEKGHYYSVKSFF